MGLSNRVAVVTGAGSGIGQAAALALLKGGFAVVLAGRRKEALEATAAADEASRASAVVVPTDVCDPASVRNLFAVTKDRFGRLDVLFNNAGVNMPATPIEDIDYTQWKAVVDTNLTGAFLCAQAAFRLMQSQVPRGGRIINNGSLAAYAPRPNTIAYTSSKSAITGLTRSLSLDGRQHDIACGQIDIGNAATAMTARIAKGEMQANGSLEVEPRMDLRHIGSSVLYMANLPLDANVLFMTVMATKMPFVGRG